MVNNCVGHHLVFLSFYPSLFIKIIVAISSSIIFNFVAVIELFLSQPTGSTISNSPPHSAGGEEGVNKQLGGT